MATIILIASSVYMFISTSVILMYEIKQRRNPLVTFTTTWLRYFSISCLIFGVASSLGRLIVLTVVSGISRYLYSNIVCSSALVLQMLSMSLYQLSRLYYCFANEQIHSDKGYPKCLFIIMYIFGVISALSWIIINIVRLTLYVHPDHVNIINPRQRFRAKITDGSYSLSTILIPNLPAILFILCDVLILLLYSAKIRLLTGQKHIGQPVYKRIMFILHKITILTLYYYTMGYMAIVFGVLVDHDIYRPDVFSLAMFLMMDHNEKIYILFLKIVRYFCCYCCCCCCCCCCRPMVLAQLEQLEIHNNEVDNNDPNKDKQHESHFDTTNLTINDERIIRTGMELSIITVTND